MNKVLYFDCFSGIAGDMTVAALLDLGIDEAIFRQELDKLNIDGYQIQIAKNLKNGISGTSFKVVLTENHHEHHEHHEHQHRNLYDVEEIIDKSSLSDRIKELSKDIFRQVAVAEAKIHAKSIEEVHFHEVGAVDSIIDIVGVAICMDILDVDEVYSSPLHTGTGFVECAHGKFPVTAPAALEILKEVPIYSTGIEAELLTPTGAAIIKTLARDFVPLPEMIIEEIGYGLGELNLEIPNVLRVIMAKKKVKNH